MDLQDNEVSLNKPDRWYTDKGKAEAWAYLAVELRLTLGMVPEESTGMVPGGRG